MKKLLFSFLIFLSLNGVVYAFDGYITPPSMYDAGAINARNLQMLRDQQFKRQEIKDAESIQDIKDNYAKELEAEKSHETPLFNRGINDGSSQFVQDEGKIKIQSIE